MSAENSEIDINDFINRFAFYNQYFSQTSPGQIKTDGEANQIFKDWEQLYVQFITFLDGHIVLKSGASTNTWGNQRWDQLPNGWKKPDLIKLAQEILRNRDYYNFAVDNDFNMPIEYIASHKRFPDLRNRVDSVKAHSKRDFVIGGSLGLVIGYVTKPYFDRFLGFLRSLLPNRSSDNVQILASGSGESTGANLLQLLSYGLSFAAGMLLIQGARKYNKWEKENDLLLEIEKSNKIIVNSQLKMLRAMPPSLQSHAPPSGAIAFACLPPPSQSTANSSAKVDALLEKPPEDSTRQVNSM